MESREDNVQLGKFAREHRRGNTTGGQREVPVTPGGGPGEDVENDRGERRVWREKTADDLLLLLVGGEFAAARPAST
jgi:hypothetical protein